MRFLPVNLDALLVELDNLAQTLALHASLQSEPIHGVDELVPAARTVLVRFRQSAVTRAALVAAISARRLSEVPERTAALIEIPVDYSGEDLAEVAQHLGISREEVVRRHTRAEYTVAFTGFAPGFAYLSSPGVGLDVPRRATPRTRIPAGAVGLAGEFTGIYPQASPGGWQLIGVTAAPLWDLAREVPALLQPGLRVRFIDVTGQRAASTLTAPTPVAPPLAAPQSEPLAPPAPADVSPSAAGQGAVLEVLGTGLQALFQDAGRPHQARLGVGASGAMDKGALHAANRLVGNPSDTPCIETAGGGLRLRCRGDAVVAITGAEAPIQLTTAGGTRRVLRGYEAVALSDGDQLQLGQPHAGARLYLAARGGFAVVPVLGSCATDTLARLGPAPIAIGDRLSLRPALRTVVGAPELAPSDLPSLQQPVTLDVVLGPRTDWFTPVAVARFAAQVWTVTAQSNRVGLRLAGDVPLARAHHAELPSEGTVRGAIQVPPSGQPVLFMADHPLTGGYPVIAAVAPHHLDRAGQIPIGASVRFNPIQVFDTP